MDEYSSHSHSSHRPGSVPETDHVDHNDHSGHGAGQGGHQAAGATAGHGGHGDHVAQFRRLFFVNLALAVPVVVASQMFAGLLGYRLPAIWGLEWMSPILGTAVFALGGRPFLSGGLAEIKSRRPGMMLLIALAITVAFVSSWGASLGLLHHELDFWWELALLVVIMLLGHWIEMRSLAQTSTALDSLAALIPDQAEKIEGGNVIGVSPSALRPGDLVLVRPGSRVPADGAVIDGSAHLDESMITGESRPVRRDIGDPVTAGTVATDTAIRVEVTAVGADTALAGIQRLVEQAQNSSSRAQRLADRAAGWLFWFALGAGAVTAIVWLAAGSQQDAVVRTITVLVIACPHALGLAIPLVVAISTERAARAGVLIKDRLALEQMRTISTILFDKTGTLTMGSHQVAAVLGAGGRSEDEVLALAAAAEAASEHPLARAIVAAARARGLNVPEVSDFVAEPGVGVRVEYQGRMLRVGGPALLAAYSVEGLHGLDDQAADGATVVHVLVDGFPIGALALADTIRPESEQAVRELRRRGIRVGMITGDSEQVAAGVARKLGIEQVLAGVRPQDKGAAVEQVQRGGGKVAMVGDGVNDAPALARADVGIAIGAGTDVAIASAGVVLASDDPRSVLSVIELSEASYAKMKQNLWWAAGYNLVAVPLAAGVLAPIGFVLPMAVGAILMSLSTVVVALNAQLLRRLDLRPDDRTKRS